MRNFKKDTPLGILLGVGIYMLICVKSCTSDAAADTTQELEPEDFNLSAYSQVLTDHVKSGQVDYAALKAHPEHLNRFLAQLDELQPDHFAAWPDKKKLPFGLTPIMPVPYPRSLKSIP